MRRPVTPRRTDSRRTGATLIAGRSRTGNGSRYRRMWRDDAKPSWPGLTRQTPIDARGRPALFRSAGCVLSAPPRATWETTHGRWHRCRMGFPLPAPFPTKRTEETIHMKAIVVTDQAAGMAGMKLVERPEPPAAINDVVVQIHASGFVPTELAWPSTWTDRRDRDRTPS